MSKAIKVQGIELPIVREGDDIIKMVVDNVLSTTAVFPDNETRFKDESIIGYNLKDNDVVGITESLVARSAGLYITVDDISNFIINLFGEESNIALISPIYSRNRFSLILRGIARAAKHIDMVMPMYDEVGNPRGINPFTGVDIEEYYLDICNEENCELNIIKDDDWQKNYSFTNIIYCGLHDYRTFANKPEYADLFKHCKSFYSLADICCDVNSDFGVLGSNMADDERLKLFPTTELADSVCNIIKLKLFEKTGVNVIVMIYGDGCFKDPVGGIWEFADPVTSPGYTDKQLLESTPREYKLKYFIDCTSDNGILDNVIDKAKERDYNKDDMSRQGTTPRIFKDLLASLMDLTSGSSDRATPVVLVQNYF